MKLIRDKYDAIIESDRLNIEVDPIKQHKFYADKIHEELDELITSEYLDISEYADLIETIYAMAKFKGIDLSTIESARIQKLEDRGGFDKCLILVN